MNNEIALLGAFLSGESDKPISYAINAGIKPEWFSESKYRYIIMAILELWKKNKPIDILTVHTEIGKLGFEQDLEILNECVQCCATWTHAEYYLEQVENDFLKRQLELSLIGFKESMENDKSIIARDLAINFQEGLFEIIGEKKNPICLYDLSHELLNKWENKKEIETVNISWPLESIHNLIGNLSDEYCILASKPSVGKTAFALQFAVNNAMAGLKVSFASLESKADKIAQRLIALLGRCKTISMRQGLALPMEYEQGRQAIEQLKTLPLTVTDTSMTIEQLRAWALREKTKGAKLLIVDNMKHIRSKKIFKNRFDLFAEISLQLKFIRDDTGLPMLILHHLSAEDRIAWSSDIERDADIILVMSTNCDKSIESTKENGWSGQDIIDFAVEKNREGLTGKVCLEFKKKIQRFDEYNG